MSGPRRWMSLIAVMTLGCSVILGGTIGAGPAVAAPAFGFVNFELAGTPPRPAGTKCPGSANCTNGAGEPAIRASKSGLFYASSENGLGSGTLGWASSDGGRHYSSLLSPNDVSVPETSLGAAAGFEPGGGDTDLAVAPVKNPAGFYNVYVSSLTAAEVDVSTSTDGGSTWTLNAASGLPLDDREWVAADGQKKVCISYTTAAGVLVDQAGLHVDCSSDAGATFTQKKDAIDQNHPNARLGFKAGNMVIDPKTHIIYQTFVSQYLEDAISPDPTDFHVVYMAVSTDGGNTFTDHEVYANPDPAVGYAHNFPNVTLDAAGNVYSVFSDNHNIYYSYSKNHGTSWSAPIRVNKVPANTAIFPWSSGGDAGEIDIAYYGTSYYDGTNPPDSYPMTAAWHVYLAQNQHATSGGTFTQVAVSPVNHFGAVCEGGVGCTGNRDLYDDFGIAVSPTTGRASIIYDDDQYRSSANDPTPSGCTPAGTNTSACLHTEIATQVSGPDIS